MLVVNFQNNTKRFPTGALAIMVSTDKYLDHVVNLTSAAVAKGKRVSLFFTGNGVLLTVKPQFKQLVDQASVCICEASFRTHGLHGNKRQVPGVTQASFTTPARYAEMLAQADRHLVF